VSTPSPALPPPVAADDQVALRDYASRLRAVFDAAVDAVLTIDERGIVQSLNRSAERMFGYAAAELIGRNISVLMPDPHSSAHDGYLARYLHTGEKRVIGIGREVTARRKDGTVFPIELAVGEGDPSSPHRFTGFVRDITARKQAEELLRSQAELLDQVTNAVMVRDPDDRVTYWNRGAERMYGWTAGEAVGRTAADLFLKDRPEVIEEAERVLRDTGAWSGELRQGAKDGRPLAVDSLQTLLRDADGRPAGKIVINIDVTEKKELEAKFLRAQRLESLGTLVSGIAHDLNNVMTPILMAVKLLKKDKPGVNKRDLLDTAEASVERGTAMIRQLLAFAGGLEGERAPVHLKQVVKEVKSMLDHSFPKSIDVITDLPDIDWPITGDRTQLTQVLLNLCVNARDAMPTGGTLTIGLESKQLCGNLTAFYPGAKAGRYAVLSVSDSGVGIPPDVQQKMFDPFFTTKPLGQGTGLGLSTLVGIVRAHGGFVNVYSQVGQGTKMTVYLPVGGDSPSVTAVAPTAASAPPAGHAELLLLIDDERAILALTKATLEASGYRAIAACGGEEGLAAFRANRSDVRLVVLDMMMPGTDGPTVLAAVRREAPALPVIAASGLKPVGPAAEAVATHATAFLLKPFSDDELLHTVARLLRPADAPRADRIAEPVGPPPAGG
jgi:two-component system cell cycle sensor histidine kinase/response regulator CckA